MLITFVFGRLDEILPASHACARDRSGVPDAQRTVQEWIARPEGGAQIIGMNENEESGLVIYSVNN